MNESHLTNPGRKVGHLTITAPSDDETRERRSRLRASGVAIPANQKNHETSSTHG